ncbi:MAG: PTS sugar transporter subunit IIA [Bauldia sp.]
MDIHELIRLEEIVPVLRAQTKRQALLELARKAAPAAGIAQAEIAAALLRREREGATGVGEGVAIPHGRFQQLSRICGLFARLVRPIEFGAPDGQPVDLLFLLLTPQNAGGEHLKSLAQIARLFREPDIAARLRAAAGRAELYAVLTSVAA